MTPIKVISRWCLIFIASLVEMSSYKKKDLNLIFNLFMSEVTVLIGAWAQHYV